MIPNGSTEIPNCFFGSLSGENEGTVIVVKMRREIYEK